MGSEVKATRKMSVAASEIDTLLWPSDTRNRPPLTSSIETGKQVAHWTLNQRKFEHNEERNGVLCLQVALNPLRLFHPMSSSAAGKRKAEDQGDDVELKKKK